MSARVWLVSFPLCLLLTSIADAEDYKRIELSGSYERLSPSLYGEWKTGTLAFYHSPIRGFTYIIGLSGFSRKEGEALLSHLASYKDWTENIYTYTSISYGTNSVYLPQLRLDGEVYIKLGAKKNILPSVGLSYIKYHDVHRDTLISTGLTYYADGWNITYKHFLNRSEPGNVRSSADLISIGIGREKASWTYLDLSYGKQAYLATYLAIPEEVRQNSLLIKFSHRRWLTQNWGITLGTNYFKLEKGYEKYGVEFGVFSEF